MKLDEFSKEIYKYFPCRIIYYPGPQQIEMFTEVNNHECVLCYDEEFIRKEDFDVILRVISDDIWSFANKVNTGKIE